MKVINRFLQHSGFKKSRYDFAYKLRDSCTGTAVDKNYAFCNFKISLNVWYVGKVIIFYFFYLSYLQLCRIQQMTSVCLLSGSSGQEPVYVPNIGTGKCAVSMSITTREMENIPK